MCTESQAEHIKASLSHFAKINHINDWGYSIEKLETSNQNYFGILLPLLFTGKQRDEEVQFHLIIKLAPDDQKYRESNAIRMFFSREIYVYSIVFRSFLEIVQSMDKNEMLFPPFYHSNKEYYKEYILIRNMCEFGFKSYNHTFLDYAHAKKAMKALAKFHALSFILNDTNRFMYQEIANYCVPITPQNNTRFLDVLLNRLDQGTVKFQGTEYETVFNRLRANCIKYIMMQHVGVNSTVLCHGDIWKENILFKYKNDEPQSACFIDFQTVRTCSPATDVLYLIATSTDSKLRKKYYWDLLHAYYKVLKNQLRVGNLDANKLYSKSKFNQDLKNVAYSVVIIANTSQWLYNGMQQEGNVRSKKIPRSDEEKQEFVDNYTNNMKNIIDDFKKYGYLKELNKTM